MKIARLIESNRETYGIVHNNKVATKEDITYATAVPIPQSIKEFLFDGWLQEIEDKVDKISYTNDLAKFKILPPIPNPSKIICLAFNYSDHAKEQNLTPPKDPVIVLKPRTTLCGSGSDIVCPNFVTQLDYEIELAVIIGKDCKNISVEDANSVVFGYVILNDISARDIQYGDKQFTRGKSFDTFAPCGPWITTSDEIKDPHNLKLITKLNGKIMQNSSTSNMFIKIPELISKLSKVMTLERGDIISTGTPAGVILHSKDAVFLKDNDKIEMEIENLGILKNTVKFVD
ncbi:MAG: FAA hydrolase family protein [Nitrosopumilaceae archaeon]|nr:fumarylacetoacetate hydrolase family protein [Nitrosopumilaceae archaeon]NIU00493.1 fumarylacetoacetate hydrolase family protein [Nitrosopumilaceae archaeon]NIU86876.1 FAA hydrolase family protein [Nitrosopumilaceae archaeon]NIV65556.1 FAA hydrolase family protein [Nitrosopumilaceae archaeon]NIX61095.1 FAA hydrolase family protein [Nitrosopumilaceae archaeon]